MKLQLIFLAVCACAASLLVCPPNSCETVRCAQLTQEDCPQNASLVPDATFCGCCPACITQLGMILFIIIVIIININNINPFYW
jgi:hypothetical protein